jgi:hypothetical protein
MYPGSAKIGSFAEDTESVIGEGLSGAEGVGGL